MPSADVLSSVPKHQGCNVSQRKYLLDETLSRYELVLLALSSMLMN